VTAVVPQGDEGGGAEGDGRFVAEACIKYKPIVAVCRMVFMPSHEDRSRCSKAAVVQEVTAADFQQ
jgi:hypothetical protein